MLEDGTVNWGTVDGGLQFQGDEPGPGPSNPVQRYASGDSVDSAASSATEDDADDEDWQPGDT